MYGCHRNCELLKPSRLLQRLHAVYRHERRYEPSVQYHDASLFNTAIAEHVAGLSPFARQRHKPIVRFVERVLNWCDWHDAIMKSPGQAALFDFLYKFYRRNRRAGLYPLPYNMLKKANDRYEELLPWLESIGFLVPAPFKYSNILGICRYYRVDRYKFT